MKTMRNISKELSQVTIMDVKGAFEFHKERYKNDPIQRTNGEWIYSVDTETMNEVKAYWKSLDVNCSLYSVFCKILEIK